MSKPIKVKTKRKAPPIIAVNQLTDPETGERRISPRTGKPVEQRSYTSHTGAPTLAISGPAIASISSAHSRWRTGLAAILCVASSKGPVRWYR